MNKTHIRGSDSQGKRIFTATNCLRSQWEKKLSSKTTRKADSSDAKGGRSATRRESSKMHAFAIKESFRCDRAPTVQQKDSGEGIWEP